MNDNRVSKSSDFRLQIYLLISISDNRFQNNTEIQRNINTDKLNNTEMRMPSKTQGVRTDSTHRLHKYLQKKKKKKKIRHKK